MDDAPKTTAQRNALLRLDAVSKSFQMGEITVPVLNGISMTVEQGEFTAIVGPSGSGKTTLLNLIGGLDQPTDGQIWYRDQLLSALKPRELTAFRRTNIGFVFQLYNLVPNLTARENVAMATQLSERPMEVDEALQLVGLEHRLDHFPSQLSGGEQQRVSIARAVAKSPELLLCDEPTGALDFETGRQVLRLLVNLNREIGTTVVVITHNGALAAVAKRAIHLRSGEISENVANPSPIDPMEVKW